MITAVLVGVLLVAVMCAPMGLYALATKDVSDAGLCNCNLCIERSRAELRRRRRHLETK